jgi:hypothetical protein
MLSEDDILVSQELLRPSLIQCGRSCLHGEEWWDGEDDARVSWENMRPCLIQWGRSPPPGGRRWDGDGVGWLPLASQQSLGTCLAEWGRSLWWERQWDRNLGTAWRFFIRIACCVGFLFLFAKWDFAKAELQLLGWHDILGFLRTARSCSGRVLPLTAVFAFLRESDVAKARLWQ